MKTAIIITLVLLMSGCNTTPTQFADAQASYRATADQADADNRFKMGVAAQADADSRQDERIAVEAAEAKAKYDQNRRELAKALAIADAAELAADAAELAADAAELAAEAKLVREHKITVTDGDGKKHSIRTAWYPKAYTCYHYGGAKAGQVAFSLRKRDVTRYNSDWLIFPDHTGIKGHLKRDGLNMRFSWSIGESNSYSIVIHGGGDAFYYNWTLADENGQMKVTQSHTCK